MRNNRIYFDDVYQAIREIESFVKGMHEDSFNNDRKTQLACVKLLENIGEALNHVEESVLLKYPEIPFKNIISMRNRLIHEYFGIDLEIVWNTISNLVKPHLKLHSEIIELLKS